MTKHVSFTDFVVYNILGCYFFISVIVYSALLFTYYFELKTTQKEQIDKSVFLLIHQFEHSSLDSFEANVSNDSGLFVEVRRQLGNNGVKGLFLESDGHSIPILYNLNKETSALETWNYPFSVQSQTEQLAVYVSSDQIWQAFAQRLIWYLGLLMIQTLVVWLLLRYFVVRMVGRAVTVMQQEFNRMSLDDPKVLHGEAKFLRFLEYQLLLNGMNKIIHGLAASRRELFNLNNQLEAKVAQKTQSLEEKNNTLIQLNKKLSILANTDSLTQVYNRTRFDLLFREHVEIAEHRKTALSLLLVDLDDFKLVNDKFGHQVGDHVLRHVAKLIESLIGDDGIVARWGGEEFSILLPYVDISQAQSTAESLRVALEGASFNEPTIHMTMSVGVAQLLPKESDVSLLKRADSAMYESKNSGRNQVTVDELSHSKQIPLLGVDDTDGSDE